MNNDEIYKEIIEKCNKSRILENVSIPEINKDCCKIIRDEYFGNCNNENCEGLAKYSQLLHSFRINASNCNKFINQENIIDYFFSKKNNDNSNTSMNNNNNPNNNTRKRKVSSCCKCNCGCNFCNNNDNNKKSKTNNDNTESNNNTKIKKKRKNPFIPQFNGIRYENRARDKYIEETELNVVQCGTIVPPKVPWLSFQPDGLITKFAKSGIYKLLEIKTPDNLENVEDNTLLNHRTTRSYLEISGDGSLSLKTRGSYYDQIQLSLGILDLTTCDFVIYSIRSDDIKIIEVERNDYYCMDLLNKICSKYIQEVIPALCTTCNM